MKAKILFMTLMAGMPLAGFAQVDDMYFVPQKEEPKKTSTVVVTYEDTHHPTAADEHVPETVEEAHYATGEVRDVDEYNRRGRWTGEDGLPDDSLAYADSTEVEAEGEGSGDEYACSKRILRFCAPTVGVAVSSPLYWDLCYGPNSIYWDVYDDGIYAYAFPSSWSTFYWGPYYSWGWGWSYWGWGGPWYAGWYDPWYWRPYWHHYLHWGHPGPGIASRPVNRPSVRYREHSALARGNARRTGRDVYSSRSATRTRDASLRRRSLSNDYQPIRSTTTTRQAMRSTTTTTRSTYTPSRSSSFTPSTRSTYRPTVSSPSRGGGGGGGFSPSRGGGGARGGRR